MMQKAVAWAKQIGIQCQVSLEERMACGIRICQTCAVAVKREPDAEVMKTDAERWVIDAAVVRREPE